ncbi:MAG: RNA polymerase sigma factor [Ruminiclostridium sp.]|nr:RNA polymerase sigma factor [Ruminiclostridium sp.]MBR4112117.1 RNA polymerase sigma factor [Ruminiclostridium sp.]
MTDEQDMLERIYRRHYLTVYRLALAKCGGKQENANDVFGEVFLQLAKYLRKGRFFNDENHEKAWLIRVTLNCSKVIFRTYLRPSESVEDKGYYIPESDGEVYEAVMRLSEKYRVVIHLFYFEGYSIREIASLLNVNENTVKSRLSRARKMMKTDIEQERKGNIYEPRKI